MFVMQLFAVRVLLRPRNIVTHIEIRFQQRQSDKHTTQRSTLSYSGASHYTRCCGFRRIRRIFSACLSGFRHKIAQDGRGRKSRVYVGMFFFLALAHKNFRHSPPPRTRRRYDRIICRVFRMANSLVMRADCYYHLGTCRRINTTQRAHLNKTTDTIRDHHHHPQTTWTTQTTHVVVGVDIIIIILATNRHKQHNKRACYAVARGARKRTLPDSGVNRKCNSTYDV